MTPAHLSELPATPTPSERLLGPFQRFGQMETAGGIVLLLATAAALVWANSPASHSYHALWETRIGLTLGRWRPGMSLHHFVNDGLMVVFFFLVGLEIKREILVGELASVRAAALPIVAAIGGMIVPALIYAGIVGRGPGAAGWGIPMATDIAFAIGILALVGPHAPVGLKVFLTAVAIVDDLGAVLVIALFYTSELDLAALGLGFGGLAALAGFNRLGVRHPGPYALVGVFIWIAFLESGVHATVAGVLLAMTVPARTRIDAGSFLESGREILRDFDAAGEEGKDVLTNAGQQEAIRELEEACEKGQAPLLRLEHGLEPWVAFGIIPIFALANAGVVLNVAPARLLFDPITLGVILGLVLGKPLGITLFAWLSVHVGWASLSAGTDWRQLHAVSWLGGIGFTMSLFVTGLAFGEIPELLDSAKLGILAASVLAAVMGWLMLRRAAPGAPRGAGTGAPASLPHRA